MRLCARGSVKAVPLVSRSGVERKLPIPVVNWLVSPGGTRHCIARSVGTQIHMTVRVANDTRT
ncbi:hypothetical protein FKL28_24355 [Klebsiella pneumoniae]|nr:hypothetical protein [Klebsiella pneumoniae]